MARPLAVLLALAGGYFGRDSPGWGAALLAGAAWAGWVSCRSPVPRGLVLFALLAVSFAGWRAVPPSPAFGPQQSQPLRFRGVVAEDPVQGAVGPRVLVDLESLAGEAPGPWSPASGRLLLQVLGSPQPPPGAGDVALFSGRPRPPWGFRNPGSGSFEGYLARQGVVARCTAPWPGKVCFGAPGPGSPSSTRWRRATAASMARSVPGRAGGVLAALTLGDWSSISRETSDSFRKAGTTHLVAISGLHLGILAMLVVPPIRWGLVRIPGLALRRPVEPLARLIALPVLAAYAALSGLQTSTLRALAMAGLVVVGGGLSRPASPLGLLAAGTAVLAAARPQVLGDPGLQLSVAALAGLFWLAPRLKQRLWPEAGRADPLAPPPRPLARLGRSAASAALGVLIASVCATLATMPVCAFHFGSSSLLGLALNPVAVPLVEFFCLPVALGATALHPVWPGGAELLWAASGAGIELLLRLQDLLVPLAPALSSPALRNVSGVLGALSLLAAGGLVLEGRRQLRTAMAAAALGMLGLGAPWLVGALEARMDAKAHLWALDVGQGQALVLRLPGPRWMAVDGGGFPGADLDPGERIVIPALEALGAGRLWLVVSTHPHPDHVVGLTSVVRMGRPELLWLPASFAGDERYGPLLEAARGAGTAVEWIGAAGKRLRAGGADLDVRCVPGPDENDRSLVLRVECGGRTALLPADVQKEGQDLLLASGFSPRCDVLVAPHHGSANAIHEGFLRAARPSAVFVSASGRQGLPSARFLSAIAGLGPKVLTTYEAGCLHASFGPDGFAARPAAR